MLEAQRCVENVGEKKSEVIACKNLCSLVVTEGGVEQLSIDFFFF